MTAEEKQLVSELETAKKGKAAEKKNYILSGDLNNVPVSDRV